MTDRQWHDEALCAQTDPDLFYSDHAAGQKKAARICLDCPVRQKCLDDALQRREPWGVWGGKSAKQRLAMLREADPDFYWPSEEWHHPQDRRRPGHSGPWRDRTHCSRGHALTGHNILMENGNRRCRQCKNLNWAVRRQERRRKLTDDRPA